jgi:hypothetical protein
MGRPPGDPQSVIEDPLDTASVLLGVEGGVFRHRDGDTTWAYAGLSGALVMDLVSFPYFRPHQIFAETDWGLYVSGTDTNWTWLNAVGIGPENTPAQFLVSPQDTNLWVVGTINTSLGNFSFSHDAGQTWSEFWPGHSLLFSRIYQNTLYCAFELNLWRMQLEDTIPEQILTGYTQPVYHSTQPWLYVRSRDSLGRYNETDGQFITISFPDWAGNIAAFSHVLGEGVLIGTSAGLCLVSDDLSSWQLLNEAIGGRICYTSSKRCVAGNWNSLFTASNEPSSVAVRPFSYSLSLDAYPNPFNSSTTIRYSLSNVARARIKIYNLLGCEVALLQDERIRAGQYSLPFAANALPSGIYFVCLQTPNNSLTIKLMHLK